MIVILNKFIRFASFARYKRIMENIVKQEKRTLETSEELTEVKKLKTQIEGDALPAAPDTREERVEVPNTESSTHSYKGKKLAMLLTYSGKDYFGMQINHGFSTIEGDLVTAMHKAGLVGEDCLQNLRILNFQRASRTDKGVSAVRQVISLKLPPQDDLSKKINEHLPPRVRVVAWKRVTKSFDAKNYCSGRTYSYMLPTFAFTPMTELTNENYRISKEVIEKVNSLLAKFEGTHNFHNYTSQREASSPSCRRHILKCSCSSPFILGGIEFAIIHMKGQSFMLHQIRKMVGLTIAIARGLAPPTILVKAWGHDKLDIPKAPGLGLMLENVHFDWYNDRYGNDGTHESLLWDDYNDYIQKFKEEYILPTIVETEKTERSMLNWLETLVFHTYDVRDSSPPYHYYKKSGLVCALANIAEDSENNEPTAEKTNEPDETKIQVAVESNN